MGGRLLDVVLRGAAFDALGDVHVAAEAGEWCVPLRRANMLGLGADARWLGSRAQVVVAAILSIALRQTDSFTGTYPRDPHDVLSRRSTSVCHCSSG